MRVNNPFVEGEILNYSKPPLVTATTEGQVHASPIAKNDHVIAIHYQRALNPQPFRQHIDNSRPTLYEALIKNS